MPLLANFPLTASFLGVSNLEARGLNVSGNSYTLGISDAIQISNGAALITVKETDVETYGERRSEMSFKHQLDPTGERWYTWEFMVPSSWGSTEKGFCVMQIHEIFGDPVAVQFTLHLENSQLVSRVPVDVSAPGTDSYRVGNHPFEFDVWYSMCLHANWQFNGSGFWEMFVNREPMFKRLNFSNCYDRAQGGYLKLGIYNFNAWSDWDQKQAYYRNVNVWSGNDGYTAVIGGTPTIPTRRVAF